MPDRIALQQTLATGLAELHLPLAPALQHSLLDFIDLLVKWNRVYNLTAVRDARHMISRHLLDSLSIMPYLQGKTLLDIGTGAGLPGVPVALVRPDMHCLLLDSNGKKTRFVQQAINELGLQNARVQRVRIQELQSAPFDTVVSRAFSSPVDIIESAGHLLSTTGSMIFMLGHSDGFLDALPAKYELTRLESVSVPFETGARHIAICRHRRK